MSGWMEVGFNDDELLSVQDKKLIQLESWSTSKITLWKSKVICRCSSNHVTGEYMITYLHSTAKLKQYEGWIGACVHIQYGWTLMFDSDGKREEKSN